MLLARPPPYSDECLVSYLIRVSEQNGFKHIGHLLHYAGLNWKNNRAPVHQILAGEFDLAPLLLALGLVESRSKISPIYQTFRRAIDTTYIFTKFPKVCPECLEEDRYCNYQWALSPVIACVKHKRMLIDVSTTSGRKLTWYRQHLNRFDDESGYIKPARAFAKPAAIQQSLLIDSLLSEKRPVRLIPVVLQGLGFREVVSLIHLIAHYQIRLVGGSFNSASMQNHELAKVYENVWVTLMGWPDGFYALLGQYVQQPMSSNGHAGLNKHFRDLYERLHRQQENKGVARVKVEFDRYIEQHWPGVLVPERITRIPLTVNARNIISKKDAANILGCRLARMDRLLQQNRLAPVIFKGKAHYLRDQVEQLAREISSNWTMAEACDALEITRYQLKQLLDAGVVPALQKPDCLNRDWVIDKRKCVALIMDLRSGARKSEPPSDAVCMASVQRQGYSIVQLVSAMQIGAIKYGVGPDFDNPNSFKQFINFSIKSKRVR